MKFFALPLSMLVVLGGIATAWSAQLLPKQTFRVDLDLVLVTVTVLDADGRPVTDLTRDDFLLWEDRVQQEIEHFSREAGPASVGVILDVSRSMEDEVMLARDAAVTFLESGNTEDEYFLLEFSDRPAITQGFTRDIGRLQNRLIRSDPEGETALFDAVYRGIVEVEKGQNPRKALLIVTDGEDNHSRYSMSNIRELVWESDVQIYAVGLAATFGRSTLRRLTDMTGGGVYYAGNARDLDSISRKISTEMKGQYVLGYVSSNTARDGRWRDVRVHVVPRPDLTRMTVRARKGYYAAGL